MKATKTTKITMISVELTPLEVAHISAALGVTTAKDLQRSFTVREAHLPDEEGKSSLYREFKTLYGELTDEGAF